MLDKLQKIFTDSDFQRVLRRDLAWVYPTFALLVKGFVYGFLGVYTFIFAIKFFMANTDCENEECKNCAISKIGGVAGLVMFLAVSLNLFNTITVFLVLFAIANTVSYLVFSWQRAQKEKNDD